MHIRHTVSRLKKFDAESSPYSYIRLDEYAPESNKTAIYLGPVKTKKSARVIYLPDRARQALMAVKENTTQYAEGRDDFDPHDLVFCTPEGHPFDAKVLEEGFQNILTSLGLHSLNLHATRTPLPPKPCRKLRISLRCPRYWAMQSRPPRWICTATRLTSENGR